MASRPEPLLLDNPDDYKAWLLAFQAHCRAKGIVDKVQQSGGSAMTDKFLERCGSKSILKLLVLLPGKDVDQLEFSELKKAIEAYVRPRERLIIADRTYFLQTMQRDGESVQDFLARLNEQADLCKWEELKTVEPRDELVRLRFIAGVKENALKLKLLEKLQLTPDH